jgi:hypothetical protein
MFDPHFNSSPTKAAASSDNTTSCRLSVCWASLVAHVSRIAEGGRCCVIVRGRLQASDLNRLEHLCGPALEHRTIPLDIHLEQVTEIDAAAQVYLDRLAARGAILYERHQTH